MDKIFKEFFIEIYNSIFITIKKKKKQLKKYLNNV